MENRLILFPRTVKALFTRRLNRFALECLMDGKPVRAHLPNPGRLWELLLPGKTVYLTESDSAKRMTAYTAVAVLREGLPVFLHTHETNRAVAWLLDQKAIPGLEKVDRIEREKAVGNSRFDFLLHEGNRPFYLEVKSCTLFGNKIAMFPDAVTARGQRHLLALSRMPGTRRSRGVLFFVHWPRARFFLPDYHTDPDFAATFLAVRDRIRIQAVAAAWDGDLGLSPRVRELAIPWELIRHEAKDRGSYLLVLRLDKGVSLSVGKMGRVSFEKGHYIYVGSARRGLSRRIDRHLRKRKTFFWHIDYLRNEADKVTAIPIRSGFDDECDLATDLAAVTEGSVPGFGCSDCSCDSHLFRMTGSPLSSPPFIDLLLHYRIGRLENLLP